MSAHQLLRTHTPRIIGTAVMADYVVYGRVEPLAAVIVCQSPALAVITAAALRKMLRNVADDELWNMYISYWLRRYGNTE